MLSNKRLALSLLIALVIASIFWSQSRVPALNEKAQMGLRTNYSSIAFDVVLPVTAKQSPPERVVRSTVNWAYTNWKGMTFGLLFAAAALTILGNLRRRSFQNQWLNTLAGVMTGAPLGVCVNCATPIAQGIYTAGARLETALATLISSPTLNVIVITMAFTLLPVELAVTKLLGVFVLLATIPWLSRRFGDTTHARAAGALWQQPKLAPETGPPDIADSHDESFATAGLSVLRDYLHYLVFIVKTALPLMLLAGLIGALAIEIVPFDFFSGVDASIGVIVGAALFATLLPVPIAFDVIVVMALLANGVDVGIAATLLFGLGIYSVYPAFVIARNISPKLSVALGITVALIAVGIGYGTDSYLQNRFDTNRNLIASGMAQSKDSVYRQAVGICRALSGDIATQCFVKHLDTFTKLRPTDSLCKEQGDVIDRRSCVQLVEAHALRSQALRDESPERCAALASPGERADCASAVVLRAAIRQHDIDVCRQLDDPQRQINCRQQYINSSLLFYPDGRVCDGLEGQELSICEVNAAIYQFADVRNFAGCDTLPLAAQDQCRYVIASSMVGRSDDRSGCKHIRKPELVERCNALSVAWQAEREDSLALCDTLSIQGLVATCQLRIASRRIDKLMTDFAFAAPAERDSGMADDGPTPIVSRPESAPGLAWQPIMNSDALTVEFAPYPGKDAVAKNAFEKIAAADVGIDRQWQFGPTDIFEPFIFGKGIASGDFNNDTWPDLVLATERGIALYLNVGGQFQRVTIIDSELSGAPAFLVAFVDADNDGRQDIFASAYGGKNFVLFNRGANFARAEALMLPGEQQLTLAAGFGDIDRDGDIDFVLGNWSSGIEKLFAPTVSANQLLYRGAGGYRASTLSGPKGETLSVLLADINDDDLTDVLIANDRTVPDVHYLGQPDGRLLAARNEAVAVPVTSLNTMSLEAADFDNDLRLDIFSTDMTFAQSTRTDYCAAAAGADDMAACQRALDVYNVVVGGHAADCADLPGATERQRCYVAYSIKAAKIHKDATYCDYIPRIQTSALTLCAYLARPIPAEDAVDPAEYAPQVQRNTLLLKQDSGFVDRAERYGIESSFWSWNAQAADLDNDGWQDIYIGNGFHFGDSFYEIQENVLYHNQEGQGFEEVAADWGLNDAINTPSYTYVDYDLDGDLDIVATGVLASPRLYRNGFHRNNSITVRLIDDLGNSAAIGAEVTIGYGTGEVMRQRKTVKLSGGFLSFNNPTLYFGLGDVDTVEMIAIRWPDGSETMIDAALDANGIYSIRRKSK